MRSFQVGSKERLTRRGITHTVLNAKPEHAANEAETVAETVVRLFALDNVNGECWFVQPGREPSPYGFRGLPGPKGGTPPPALTWEDH